MDLLEEAIERLAKTHRRVWYVLDGLYSMLGDFCPIEQIAALLAKYPQLHAYIDDAHSTSWIGEKGRGYALEHLPDRSRVVVALTLAKAFCAGGAVLVFSSDEDRRRVRYCGGPMMFSGPVQPALLGAALASAKLHLRPEFADLQRGLATRIDSRARPGKGARRVLRGQGPDAHRVRPLRPDEHHVRPRAVAGPGGLLHVRGSVFPAVLLGRAGVRITFSMENTIEDIDDMLEVLSREARRLAVAA